MRQSSFHTPLQQYLPLAVLKQYFFASYLKSIVLLQQYLPLAVLKLTIFSLLFLLFFTLQQYLPLAVLKRVYAKYGFATVFVATVLTACGIETLYCYSQLLQIDRLQQRLPLAVLNPVGLFHDVVCHLCSCNSIETHQNRHGILDVIRCCNRTYRLQY